MEPPAKDRARDWRTLDAEGLADLLASGLTPDEVGALFARSGSSVRNRARTWGLDARALRARAHGLAARYPELASQFVEVVDGAPLDHRAQDLAAASGARCRWRCPTCSEQWVTSVANRTTRRSGCPACARNDRREAARRRPRRSPPLSLVSADLVGEFVRNLTWPAHDASTTASGSDDRILWLCRSGHEWEASARQRVTFGTQCPTCLSGLWTSRLEHQVAELVQSCTGLTVTLGARAPRRDRAVDERIDMLVEGLDVFVDLDPIRWHERREAVARDTRKLQRMTELRYVRVRPPALGRLAAGHPHQQVFLVGGTEDDPEVWASAVLAALRVFAPALRLEELTPDRRDAALARGDASWRRLRAGARSRSLLTEFPGIAAELVEVVGRPGPAAADLAPAGDDRAAWRCSACGHEWVARVANRTIGGTGCPRCAARRGALRAAMPRPGHSFADAHPELVEFFIVDESRPGTTLRELKPNSVDRCRWRCRHCGADRTATPHDVHRRPQGGCSGCAGRRSSTTRRRGRASERRWT